MRTTIPQALVPLMSAGDLAMVLTGKNQGLVSCRDTVLQFEGRKWYHTKIMSHLGCQALLGALGVGLASNNIKAAPLRPYSRSRNSAVSPRQVTPLAVIPKGAQSMGQLLQLPLQLLSNKNIDRTRHFFTLV